MIMRQFTKVLKSCRKIVSESLYTGLLTALEHYQAQEETEGGENTCKN